MNEFDPEKLVELMKKNGEWDEDDEQMYGAEALKAMQENPEDPDGEGMPPYGEELDEKTKAEYENLYKQQMKKGGRVDPDDIGPFQQMMMQGAGVQEPNEEDEKEGTGLPGKNGIEDDEDFLFEKYLKSGEYLDITRKRR